MNQEDEMTETHIPGLTPALRQIRGELMTAVARDRSRAARRHKTVLLAATAVVAAAAVGSAIAAATGVLARAAPGHADVRGSQQRPRRAGG
jgi:hypothetical protein